MHLEVYRRRAIVAYVYATSILLGYETFSEIMKLSKKEVCMVFCATECRDIVVQYAWRECIRKCMEKCMHDQDIYAPQR